MQRALTALIVLLGLLAGSAVRAQEDGDLDLDDPGTRPSPRYEDRDGDDDDDDGGRPMYTAGVRGGVWLGFIEGDVRSDEIGSTRFDLEDDVGVESPEGIPFVEAFVRLRWVTLSVSGFIAEFEGEEDVSREITFGGVTFEVNERVESKAELRSAAVKLQLNPISFETVEVGVIVGLRYFGVDAELESESQNVDEEESFDVPLPLVGLGATIFLGPLEIHASAAGIAGEYDDFEATYFEAEASLTFRIIRQVGVGLGYFYYQGDFEEEDGEDEVTEVDVRLHGPMVFLRLQL
jgi:hypothetical protein